MARTIVNVVGFFAAMALLMANLSSFITNCQSLTNRNILFLTAHPDDEAMFFGPSIIHATEPRRGNSVHLLCLSTGNNDGLGETRVGELKAAGPWLGIPATNISVIDDKELQDGQNQVWDDDLVAEYVKSEVEKHNINTIVTFDYKGVSNHANHKALFKGTLNYLVEKYKIDEKAATFSGDELDEYGSVLFMTLNSVSLLRKYTFVLDNLVTRLSGSVLGFETISAGNHAYFRIRSAMTMGHKSQVTWYRYLWLFLSRYMVVNDVGKITIKRVIDRMAELDAKGEKLEL